MYLDWDSLRVDSTYYELILLQAQGHLTGSNFLPRDEFLTIRQWLKFPQLYQYQYSKRYWYYGTGVRGVVRRVLGRNPQPLSFQAKSSLRSWFPWRTSTRRPRATLATTTRTSATPSRPVTSTATATPPTLPLECRVERTWPERWGIGFESCINYFSSYNCLKTKPWDLDLIEAMTWEILDWCQNQQLFNHVGRKVKVILGLIILSLIHLAYVSKFGGSICWSPICWHGSMADPGSRGRGLDPSFISAFVVIGYGLNKFTVSEIIVNNYLNDLNEDQNL